MTNSARIKANTNIRLMVKLEENSEITDVFWKVYEASVPKKSICRL